MAEMTQTPSSSGFQITPNFYTELVDKWEYTGFPFKEDLDNPVLRLQLRDTYWHKVHQLSGKCLCIFVELIKSEKEESSQSIVIKICDYAMKYAKIDYKVVATTTVIARREAYSSYWMHIEDSERSKKLGLTLRIMKIASEHTFDTVLIRQRQSKGFISGAESTFVKDKNSS